MAKEKKIEKKKRKITFGSIFGGKILLESKKRMDIVIFVAVIIVMYISYTYRTQNLILEIESLKKDIENMRAEKVTVSSKLMNHMVQSNIIKQVKQKNLKIRESKDAPYIIEDGE